MGKDFRFGVNPLVPAAALFLGGAAMGWEGELPIGALLAAMMGGWVLWLLLEMGGEGGASGDARRLAEHFSLAVAIFFGGAAVVALNQRATENVNVARFAPGRGEVMISCRADVVVAPKDSENFGNAYWTGRVQQIWTDRGWMDCAGDVLVKWAAGRNGVSLRRGMRVELQGWLSRPLQALNPGGRDARKMLAADRVFAEIRVPRARGVAILSGANARPPRVLSRVRLFLRGKLLEHTVQRDVPAAYTITALLLGYRDPAIGDVSRAFADAGVAHLLAISGSHVVFFSLAVWALLRFFPIRPRRREILMGGIVIAYVLATPCGPPIVRAAVGVLAVLLSRMVGRAPQHLNTVALAAVAVVLIRPADLADAGFQLTFVTTAALVLLSERLHAAVFGEWLGRLALIADMGRGFRLRMRYRAGRVISAVIVGNGIGAISAAPLVAFHFGQVNLWGIVTGFVALPLVSAAMVMGMVQLLAEMAGRGLGAAISPVTADVGQALIRVIEALAALPGAAVALRPMPAWLILLPYVWLLVCIGRRRLGISRAVAINMAVACAVILGAWISISPPRGAVRVTVLSAGTGSDILLRTPGGRFWGINAGSAQGGDVLESVWRPAMRMAGSRRWEGAILAAFDAREAGEAPEVIAAFPPRSVWLSDAALAAHGQTLAGAQVANEARSQGFFIHGLARGRALDLGEGLQIHVLWPPPEGVEKLPLKRRDLILMLEYQRRRVLVVDPGAGDALGMVLFNEPTLRCDAIIFTGPARGAADEALRRLIVPLQAKTIIWTGRGSWAPRQSAAGEFNTAEGAIDVFIHDGRIAIASN